MPFRDREGIETAGLAGSDVFCRFDRREAGGSPDSGSGGGGLGSRAEALRFLDGVGC